MAIGEYHDTHEYDECCDDFHRRRSDIIYHVVEDKSSERESELKYCSKRCRDVMKSTIIESCCEDISNENKEKDIERIFEHAVCNVLEVYRFLAEEHYNPTYNTSEEKT
jgi:hypothetical protein